jgi:hypothetical protein
MATWTPAVVTEEFHTQRLVPLNGAEGYREWLHIIRLDDAVAAKRRADHEARIAASWLTCGVCGRRDNTVASIDAPMAGAPGGRVRAHVCLACQPLTEEALRARLLDNADHDVLPDGRTKARVRSR